MPFSTSPELKTRKAAGGSVERRGPGAYRLEIPAGPARTYRLAQIDDYFDLPRRDFCWKPPFTLSLRARVSAREINGTWGFGLWNDPFTASFGLGGQNRRLPVLPNTIWFFYASPPNYLSLRDQLPAQGLLAATFRSLRLPTLLMALGLPVLPFALWPWAARRLRRLLRIFVRQSSSRVEFDPSQWHSYQLTWYEKSALFWVDGQLVSATNVSPRGPLGLVMWIDNQYAAFTPHGRVSVGMLPTAEPAWIELEDVQVKG